MSNEFSIVYLLRKGKRGGLNYQIAYVKKEDFDDFVEEFDLKNKVYPLLQTMNVLVVDAYKTVEDLNILYMELGQAFRNTKHEEQLVLKTILEEHVKKVKYDDLVLGILSRKIQEGGR